MIAPKAKSYRFSATAIQRFSECEQKYFLERVLKVNPDKRETALEFGGAIDKAIRHLYAKDWDAEGAVKLFESVWKDDPTDKKRTLETGKTILRRYATAYKQQDLKLVDQGFAFLLTVPEYPQVTILGELDRVVEQGGRLMPSEFKTTSQLTADYLKRFWWDIQTGIYLMAARQLIDKKITAVHLDALLVAKSDPSKLQSAPYLRDIIEHPLEKLAYMRSRIVQLIGRMLACYEAWESGENDLWCENDQACTNYGGCKYLGYCRQSPSVRQSIIKSEYVTFEVNSLEFAKYDTCKQGELIV